MTDSKRNHRYQTIMMYEQRIITAQAAAQSIGVTERQFYGVVERFRQGERTPEALAYQSHEAWNRTDRETEENILALSKDNPEALNSHLSWLFWDAHGKEVKSATARNILIRHEQYIPFKHKRERAYKKFQATHFGALASNISPGGPQVLSSSFASGGVKVFLSYENL